MKHWDKLIIDSEVNITGRGLVLTTNLKRNGLTDSDWVDDVQISKGDTLTYNDVVYEIRNVEMFSNLFDGKKSSNLGLVVKKIN
jgi:hypothetical protein